MLRTANCCACFDMARQRFFADTRTVLQIEPAECGAASLSMILQYFGQYVSLEQLRIETDVSRDGCSAGNIARAAGRRGLQCDGYRKTATELMQLEPPCMLWWDRNHFVVYEGTKGESCYLNDPAYGKRKLDRKALEEHFSGIVLTFTPLPEFSDFPEYGRKPATYLRSGRASRFFCAHKGRAAAAVLAGILSAAAGLAAAEAVTGWAGPGFGMPQKSFPMLGMLAVLLVCHLLFRVLSDQQLRRLEDESEVRGSWGFLQHLFSMPIPFLEQRSPGELAERVHRNDRINRFTAGGMLRGVIDLGSLICCILFLSWHSLRSGLVLLLSLLVVGILQLLQEHALRRDRTKAAISDAKLASAVFSGTGKLETIRNLGLDKKMAEDAICRQRESIRIHRRLKNVEILNTILRYIIYALCLLAGPDLFLAVVLAILVIPSAESLRRVFSKIRDFNVEIGPVDDILRTSEAAEKQETGSRYRRLQGNLRCHDVSFSYGAFGEPVVADLNLYLPVGSTLAVTGPSGSGKSTVGKLLAGLLQPTGGAVLYDKYDAGEVPERVMQASIAVVEQKARLFEGSIRDNITMWNPHITEEALRRALSDACIEECIKNREDGLDTLLGPRGAGLSGGEQQRVEIARALASNPSILILDEAFSAIDDETTQRIVTNIRRRGCTLIVVTHDPLLIDLCGQRLDLGEGGRQV